MKKLDNETNRETQNNYEDLFNYETIEANEEVKEMMRNPKNYKSFNDVDEMLKELLQ